MPRTTVRRYLKDRTWLRQVWENDRGMFAQVDLPEQRYLHDFYAPVDDLSDVDALEHRQAVSLADPSLPQRAGRALKALKREVAVIERYRRESLRLARKLDRKLPTPGPKPKRHRVKVENIVVRPVLRPKPDARAFAKALVAMAEQLTKEDRASPAPMASVAERRRGSGRVVRRRQSSRDADQSF